MAVVLASVTALQAQHVFVAVFVLLVFMAAKPLLGRLNPPRSAPSFLKSFGLGAPGFSKRRAEYLRQASNGYFSFWYGANHVVAVSGADARSTFLTSRGLDPLSGHLAVLGSVLNVDSETSGYARAIFQIFKTCRQDQHISRNLHHLVTDSHECFKALGSTTVMNPLDIMIGLVYQLTHRIIGVHDIADSQELLAHTRKIYKPLEESSVFDIWFPLLPTPSKLKKFWGYTRLHRIIQGFIQKRRETAARGADGLQLMMDQGCNNWIMSLAITGAIVAGVFNTSVSAVWNLCYLTHDPPWLSRVRKEIEDVLSKHRRSASESVTDILHRLSLQDWENSFPLLGLALKETIRFTMSGPMLRKNIGDSSISLGNTGYVIPRNSLSVYLSEDVHMNPQVYESPSTWDPSRYSQVVSKKAEVPYSYLGWGAGNHPCPGMRFAHLNTLIPTVMFIAKYDFEMCDAHGSITREPMPDLVFDCIGAGRPERPVYMKVKERISSST
ncbi:hypothetical protein FSARC_2616 [Fusarium sarcochroum]|uniref:Cytochrome P450 monooxygenase n=1 Tax=Fusarium sarcochroum TaxID=1208366 RepID=A0A8H4U5N2_9HYPO|nr:hypothetical protein FSARC_2616 [Fusarium sarcochroum]